MTGCGRSAARARASCRRTSNPVMAVAIRLFQALEQAPPGLNVVCANAIPLDAGLGARTALIVGGLVGANNLLGGPFQREELIQLAAELSAEPAAVVTAIRGGLGVCAEGPDGLLYRSVEITPLRVVVALPLLPDTSHACATPAARAAAMPCTIPATPRYIEALRSGDFRLLRHTVIDRLHDRTAATSSLATMPWSPPLRKPARSRRCVGCPR